MISGIHAAVQGLKHDGFMSITHFVEPQKLHSCLRFLTAGGVVVGQSCLDSYLKNVSALDGVVCYLGHFPL